MLKQNITFYKPDGVHIRPSSKLLAEVWAKSQRNERRHSPLCLHGHGRNNRQGKRCPTK